MDALSGLKVLEVDNTQKLEAFKRSAKAWLDFGDMIHGLILSQTPVPGPVFEDFEALKLDMLADQQAWLASARELFRLQLELAGAR